MLNLYGSFKVPGVDHVQIYRDDQDPHQFYMMSERPTIARDDEGNPLFTFILYARDVDRIAPDDLEVERGYMSLSTQAGVSQADETKIRAHLAQMLNGERGRNYRFLGRQVSRVEPNLGYPPLFTEGTVEFVSFSENVEQQNGGVGKPSLIGSNIASFARNLNQTEAEVFRQAVLKGKLPAIVRYDLKFVATIPAISIHVYGSMSDFYREVKEHVRVTHTRREDGKVVYRKSWLEIGSINEFRSTFRSITIDIDDRDFRDADPSDNTTQQLQDLAFALVKDNIFPMVFKEVAAGASEEQSKDKWLTEIEKTMTGTVDVWIRKSDAIQKRVGPNAQLAQVLKPAEVEANTIYIDLSNPFFQELDVRVNANVNFAADPVYGLKVFLQYDQQDEQRNVHVKKAKEFLFKSADTTQRFRQIMAKAGDGAPKDTYTYWSQVIYKDTGETIRIPREGASETNERELVISYRRLGFVKVNVLLGAMPESVRSATVRLRYPGGTGPSADQSFELTREKPTASFFTYTGHADEAQTYRYQISYTLTDGQRMDLREESGQSETLTVTNPFEQTVSTRFLAQADFSLVDKIIVDARYRDAAHDFAQDYHAELSGNGDTAAWAFDLRDPHKRDMQYDVIIVYKNGAREEQRGLARQLGETVPVGIGATAALEVSIVADLLDWTKYRLVLVYLDYTDTENRIHEEKNITFKPDGTGTADASWKVLLRDKERKGYRYRVRYIGVAASDTHEVTWTDTTDPVLVLE